MNLSETVSIVTGGTSGIGRAIVSALAQQGGRVAFCSRSASRVKATVEECRSAGLNVLGATCDVRDAESIGRFVYEVRQQYGVVDVLVNNAGLAYFAPLAKLTDDQIQEIIDVNVLGVFRMIRAVLDEMLSAGSGAIVNIASLAGKNGVAQGTAYAASKHAIMGLSRSLMLEVRQKGVRVIAICPGSVETDFFENAGMTITNPERVLQPVDVASTVVAALSLPERALVSELDVRPSQPL